MGSTTVIEECSTCGDCGKKTRTCYNTKSPHYFTAREPTDTCDEWGERDREEDE